ncbi:DUF2726 domain-containing protein [Novosphingobium album (ex Hu et al. 2023)]|uniref:DUF2726 domain-containing protein n=1 Tax=Novosphingobium album (ex Hu et al. 2023) TaxID=2930093 RepID=A0ABT0B534_9SPHN|nr:DUF2726 domain-containing protein [Novosphingobium album (ex Hu et al. 2023)]MCJ2180152.1 DUF2726 domain-containing protein [Novosphingobium album (ex Hu et al. 2023)]
MLIFAAVNVIIMVALAWLKAAPSNPGALQVTARPLMTPIERQTILFIETAMPGTRVHAQVSMGALLQPRRGLDRSSYFSTLNRFNSKRVDFIVEDRATGRVLLIVELDDKTHDARADAARDHMTARAGYVTVRLPAGCRPTAQNVRERIAHALQTHPEISRLPAGGSRQTRIN